MAQPSPPWRYSAIEQSGPRQSADRTGSKHGLVRYASGSAVVSAPCLEGVREGVAEAALLDRERVSKRPTIPVLALLICATRIED